MNLKNFLFICIVLGIFTIGIVAASDDNILVIEKGSNIEKNYEKDYKDLDLSKVGYDKPLMSGQHKVTGKIKLNNNGTTSIIVGEKEINLYKNIQNVKDGDNVTLYGGYAGYNEFVVGAIRFN